MNGSTSHCDKMFVISADALLIDYLTKYFLSSNVSSHTSDAMISPYNAKLTNLNFRSLEVVSRYRDPQLQAGEKYQYELNLRQTIHKS